MSTPLLNHPPIYTSLTYYGKTASSWSKWFTSIHDAHNTFFKTYKGDVSGGAFTAHVFKANSYTTAQRDGITNPEEGIVIWNTTTSHLNVYDGSSWREINMT